jgi:hypothetical protein
MPLGWGESIPLQLADFDCAPGLESRPLTGKMPEFRDAFPVARQSRRKQGQP